MCQFACIIAWSAHNNPVKDYYHPHFIAKETEAQRGDAMCPPSGRGQVKPGLTPEPALDLHAKLHPESALSVPLEHRGSNQGGKFPLSRHGCGGWRAGVLPDIVLTSCHADKLHASMSH